MPISLVESPDSPSSSLIYLGCQSGACSTAPGVLLRNALTPQVHSTRLLTAVLVILLALLYSSTPSWSNFLHCTLRLRPDTQPDCTRARTRSRPPRTTREARGRIRRKQAVSSYLRPELHESHHKARGRFQEKIERLRDRIVSFRLPSRSRRPTRALTRLLHGPRKPDVLKRHRAAPHEPPLRRRRRVREFAQRLRQCVLPRGRVELDALALDPARGPCLEDDAAAAEARAEQIVLV